MNPVGYIVYFQERKLTAAYVFWIRTTSVSTVHVTVSSLKNKRCSYLRKNKFNLETNYPVLKVERLCSPSNVFSDFEDWVKNSVFNQILLCWVCMYPVGSELFKKETDNIGQNNYFFCQKKGNLKTLIQIFYMGFLLCLRWQNQISSWSLINFFKVVFCFHRVSALIARFVLYLGGKVEYVPSLAFGVFYLVLSSCFSSCVIRIR